MRKTYININKIRKTALFTLILFLGIISDLSFGQNTRFIDTAKLTPTEINTNIIREKVNIIENVEQVKTIQSLKIIDSEPLMQKENVEIEQPSLQQNANKTQLENSLPVVNLNIVNDATVRDTVRKMKVGKIEIQKSPPEPNANKGTKAAPVNDLICNAININDGDCYYQADGNQNATADYYGGCIQPLHRSVWFKTTIVAPNDYLKVDITCAAGKEMECMLVSGACTSPVLVETHCEVSPFSFEFYDLSPGTYYIYFSTQPGSNLLSDFTICMDQMISPTYVTGPEQDCAGAIPVCDMFYEQTNSYDGYWNLDELPNYQTCLLGGENNSVWYVFTPQTSGDLIFTINTVKDYDWAVYNLTAIGGCSNIPGATPVLCNYSDDYGTTGLTLPVNATIPRSNSATQSPLMPGIPVVAGNTYVLIVDNYTGDGTGYTLDFTGSTASIADRPSATPPTGAYPTMVSASTSCTSNTITINMSEYVQCITIRPSDFILTNTTTSTNFTSAITSVTGYNCSINELTNQLIITHDGTLTTGHYEVTLNPAGVILADKCDNIIQLGGLVSFDYFGVLTLTPSPATICLGGTVSLDANGADNLGITYTLSPGNLTNNTTGIFSGLSPFITTNYSVSATYAGCTRTATATVTVEGNIVTSISPYTQTVCSFPTTLTASTLINGDPCVGCTYIWGSGTTPATGAVVTVASAGTYTVSTTTTNGCHNMNTPTSTISLASAGGGGSCDVLYVSPTGGGDGLTKTTPTTLSDAITKAICTNTIIKMQVGVYTFSYFHTINDYVTIEGGYDIGFTTKSSNMTGGSNSTTIRRTNTADVGFATDCSAFRAAGSDNFRIQDIRIEMPGSINVTGHSAGAGITNYGIKLGTGCTGYNIIRCYIDAGVGSAP